MDTDCLASLLMRKVELTGFQLYCYIVFISDVCTSVVGCDSQSKQLVAEAKYTCNITKQQRHLASLLDQTLREGYGCPRSGIVCHIPYAW